MSVFLRRFSEMKMAYIPLVIFIFLVTMVFVEDAEAFQRKVLLEDFTSTTCPPCAGLAPALEAGIEDAGDDVVAVAAIHVWWPGAGNDPWYLANESEMRTRVAYYGVRGVPALFVNGDSFNGRTRAAIANELTNRAEEDSPLRIDLNGVLEGTTLTATIEIEAESDVDNTELYVAIVEDYWEYRAPTGQNEHHDAVLKFMPNANGTEFSISNGETLNWEFQQDIEDIGWHDLESGNLNLVAWVQDENDHEVHQAQNFFFPALAFGEWFVVDEADGNDDGRAEPGETAGLVVTLENGANRGGVEFVTARVTCEDEDIELLRDFFEIDYIEVNSSVDNKDLPFLFTVAEDAQPHRVAMQVTVVDQNENILIQNTVEFTVGWPDILHVDASSNENAARFMREMFDNEAIPFADYIDRSELGVIVDDVFPNYDIVFWHSFNLEAGIIEEWEKQMLRSYLDGGGTMVLSSWGYIANGDENFLRNYFGASVNEEDNGQSRIHGIEGVEFFGDADLYAGGRDDECAGFPEATPSLTLENDGEAVLMWGTEEEPNGVAGVVNHTDNFKTLLLAFPIESLSGFMMTDSRASFMNRIWDWHNSGQFTPPDQVEKPLSFSLDPAFPNPFNASTVIPFSLDKAGQINLALFDLAGRKMTELYDGQINAGRHTVSFDAASNGINSGLYILKLNGEHKTAHQKILYLK